MKHTDFLKSLKTLKSHLVQTSKKKTTLPSLKDTTSSKTYCSCLDAEGERKYLYSTQEELAYILAKKDILLYTYPCPSEKGWHLTKG